MQTRKIQKFLSTSLVCNFYGCKTKNLVAQHKALFKDFCHNIFPKVFIVHMHHGIVDIGVELGAFCPDLGNAQTFQSSVELFHDHFKALAVRGILFVLADAAFQIIMHAQESGDGIDAGIGIDAFFFLCGALAVVFILCRQAQLLVIEGV